MTKILSKICSSCKNQPTTVVLALAGMVCLSFIYKTHIDAKYNRTTGFSCDKNNGFCYVSTPITNSEISVYFE